ncbi:MAG: hypothetical protein U5N58_04275 [Actinomycetota bacterium]|nr:hypothetical protein [Actinomycetota bacterium]
MKVLSVPSSQQIKQVMKKFEGARIEIYAYPGKNLSATLQEYPEFSVWGNKSGR